jgi:hypothetical protein
MRYWALLLVCCVGCGRENSSDSIQQQQSETLLAEATSKVGMPAIKNFRERKMLKDILELRDQTGLVTYTYLYNELSGKLIFFGESIGYGIPYSTQFTSPEKLEKIFKGDTHYERMPQADPNGLFAPQSAEGTWVLLKDPNGKDVRPVYVEPRIVVSPFRLNLDGPQSPERPK